MKLVLDGKINAYYIQTLCMIFFPGEKFGAEEQTKEGTPELYLRLEEHPGEYEAFATARYDGREANCIKSCELGEETTERTIKMACGSAVIGAFGELLGYRPSWGMMTGIRPSKVAMEYLNAGKSKTRTKKILTSEFFVIPKKASLATEVAVREREIIGNPDNTECSLYISIPFCPTRCSYCSFVSYTSKKLLDLIPDYLVHMKEDLKKTVATIRELGLKIKTIYIGGGTPTVLTETQLDDLLSLIHSLIDVNALEEFTLESGRPDTINDEKMMIAKKYGVTRVSVNPQSLSDEVLRNIGRAHTVEDFYRAFESARKAGFPVINSDLIIGLPGDNFKTFSKTYEGILALNPENITVHTFCVKKAAEILLTNRNVYSLRGGDAGKCVDYSQLKAQENGYIPYYMYRQKNTIGNYENVGFSRYGKEGLYNVYMMEEIHSIFAVGAGAVTKLVNYKAGMGVKPHIERLFYPKYPYEYLRDESTDAKSLFAKDFYQRLREEKQ